MGKLRRSMVVTFIITILIICVFSGVTIFLANNAQQGIMDNRPFTIKVNDYNATKSEDGYIVDYNENMVEWQPISGKNKLLYYLCYAAMIGLPVIYTVIGIGAGTTIYYRRKLRKPIAELEHGMKMIQGNDLDFRIEYSSADELGQLCVSMEKMRNELRNNNHELWEALEQRKLLNASVAHDIRTPLTVLRGYLDYLENNYSHDRLDKKTILETFGSMQAAVDRLERYVDCVRDIERLEELETTREITYTDQLTHELEGINQGLQGINQGLQGINQGLTDNDNPGKVRILFSGITDRYEINLDQTIFLRVYGNLLKNALRYAASTVQVQVSLNEDKLILTVHDDGNGFDEKSLSKATDWFYGSSRDDEHFGIGLSVCRLLCEKHGGELVLANNAGAEVIAGFLSKS